MKSINKKIEIVVENKFPFEYDVAGKKNVKDIIDGDVEFKDSKEGFNSTMFEIIGVVSTIVAILKTFYDIYMDHQATNRQLDTNKYLELVLDSLKLTQDQIRNIDKVEILRAIEDLKSEIDRND